MAEPKETEAFDELAVALFEVMERLDGSGLQWTDLTETEQAVYRASVGHLLRHERCDEAIASLRIS